MNRLLAAGLITSGLWLAGTSVASAQYYGRDDRYRDDDGRNYARGYGDYRQAFYNRLQSDLESAARNSYLRNGELRRFEQARHEIDEFQQTWARGRYDRHALDDAIGATQRVANLPGLDYRDRGALQEDLSMMRRFRARMSGNFGYRGDYYRPN